MKAPSPYTPPVPLNAPYAPPEAQGRRSYARPVCWQVETPCELEAVAEYLARLGTTRLRWTDATWVVGGLVFRFVEVR